MKREVDWAIPIVILGISALEVAALFGVGLWILRGLALGGP